MRQIQAEDDDTMFRWDTSRNTLPAIFMSYEGSLASSLLHFYETSGVDA